MASGGRKESIAIASERDRTRARAKRRSYGLHLLRAIECVEVLLVFVNPLGERNARRYFQSVVGIR